MLLSLCTFFLRISYGATAMPIRLGMLAMLVMAAPVTIRAQVPAVAAASDLQFALSEAARTFRVETGKEVKLAFGSSGNFTHQIENGAPFELFLSADEAYIERLVAKGFARDAGALYAVGRIVLFVPHGSPLKADPTLADVAAALRDGRLKRFAIANPEHAPYGRAARETLIGAGLWDAMESALVMGENASQAMQFAAGGGAQGGIVPLSLAKAPEVAKLGTAALISDGTHKPLRQRMALIKGAGPVATQFYDWLRGRSAREIFIRHGFVLPGE